MTTSTDLHKAIQTGDAKTIIKAATALKADPVAQRARRIEDLRTAIADLEADLQQLRPEIEQRSAACREARAEIERLQKIHGQLLGAAGNLQSVAYSKRGEIDRMKREIEGLERELAYGALVASAPVVHDLTKMHRR